MLNKQAVDVSFGKGLDQKTDSKRIQPGKFLSLVNTVFNKVGQLTKRNGFGPLTSLPDASSLYLTTFNSSLLAIGSTLQAYDNANAAWVNKGIMQKVSLNTSTLIKSGTGQTQADAVVAANGLALVTYTDQDTTNLANKIYKYAVINSVNSEMVVNPITLPLASQVYGTPRVFLQNQYFIIVYTQETAGPVYNLVYIAISSTNPSVASAAQTVAANYTPSTFLNFDGVVANGNTYVAYNTLSGSQRVNIVYIPPTLGPVTAATSFVGRKATILSLSADLADPSNPLIWISAWDQAAFTYTFAAVDKTLVPFYGPFTGVIGGAVLNNFTGKAINGGSQSTLTTYYELAGFYPDAVTPNNTVGKIAITATGVVTAPSIVKPGVGLASKVFTVDGVDYFLAVYYSANQPTYFLLNGSGNVISKLAYSNAGPYHVTGLSNVTLVGATAYIAYLITETLTAVNKAQGAPTAQQSTFFTQTGINLASFNLKSSKLTASEIGNNVNISGGFVTAYDGASPVEQGFNLWPDYVTLTPSTTDGTMSAQQYFYQVIYEWTDNQGNLFRSAPSIPKTVTTTGATSSVVVTVDTLRLTYKTLTPVRIVIYRWSTAQQVYYQATSVITPTLNSTVSNTVSFTDIKPDSAILGNDILYTTGGVIEDIGPPATDNITIFDNRLWLVDAEDRNLLWFSKQVIEATPVEMSDLLTVYIPPTTGSQGSTGVITAIYPMDDKLVIFKENALGYIAGTGPDNTGSNNQYTQFSLINATVGCLNQNSIVFTPLGLMFQSNKGIWLLGRDLSTTYIGAPVEGFNANMVTSAVTIPGTNQVRFTLNTMQTLVYDYYVGEWSQFSNTNVVSSTLFQGLQTFITDSGQVRQETPGKYLDNTQPVLISFTTGWMSFAGVQGFERFYEMLMVGDYITPFKLNVQFAYDFNPAMQQATIVTPSKPVAGWANDPFFGDSTPFAGPSAAFNARVFPTIQKCSSFQIQVTEIYDPSFGIASGAGLTLTGLNLLVGVKKGHRTSPAGRSFGG
jgi:hypothetical protein